MSKFTAGLIGIVLVAVFSYLAYTKFANPFAHKYTVHATFANANGLQPGSLVRIAGVNVGTVTSVAQEPGCKSASTTQSACQAADVTMNISNQGLPIHDDATFAIRPRIFLEGNFFVDVSPGTPQAPVASDNHTFPIQQGVEPVQFDQVLTGLQGDTRQNLQTLLQQYGKAVKQGGPSFNKSIQYWLPAYEYSSIVAHDALGIQPHDLSNYIAAQGQVAGALDTHPQNLENLITDFNTTANAFARENTALEQTVAELPKTLARRDPGVQRAQRRVPAAAGVRPGTRARREVHRPDGRRQPAVRHPAQRSRAAVGAARADRRPAADRPRAGQADQGHDPADAQRGPAHVQLRGQRHLPVVPAHGPRQQLQRGQRLPAAQGLRRGRRLSARVWPASRATSTPTAPTSASSAPAGRSPTRCSRDCSGRR